jgi:hypothetical protein
MISLQGDDSVSSNAGPAAAGVPMLGNLVDRSRVDDEADGIDGMVGAVPADYAELTGHANPQLPSWTKSGRGRLY